jgi:hypothetical protein
MSKRAFRVWVAGRLGDGFAKGIDPALEQDLAETNTALSGELVDQSQLYGLLQRLNSLGVEVIRFETYPPTDEPHPSPGTGDSGVAQPSTIKQR